MLEKGPEKSPIKARQPRKVDLRARYWAFLFDNLRRAVDEIYVTCESDQSVVECKVSLLQDENKDPGGNASCSVGGDQWHHDPPKGIPCLWNLEGVRIYEHHQRGGALGSLHNISLTAYIPRHFCFVSEGLSDGPLLKEASQNPRALSGPTGLRANDGL